MVAIMPPLEMSGIILTLIVTGGTVDERALKPTTNFILSIPSVAFN